MCSCWRLVGLLSVAIAVFEVLFYLKGGQSLLRTRQLSSGLSVDMLLSAFFLFYAVWLALWLPAVAVPVVNAPHDCRGCSSWMR